MLEHHLKLRIRSYAALETLMPLTISVIKSITNISNISKYSFLPDLSLQRDSTVAHYTVCDLILNKYIFRYIYRYFLPVIWTVTENVTFLVTENIPLHLPLPLLSLPHAEKYRVTGIVTFFITDKNVTAKVTVPVTRH